MRPLRAWNQGPRESARKKLTFPDGGIISGSEHSLAAAPGAGQAQTKLLASDAPNVRVTVWLLPVFRPEIE